SEQEAIIEECFAYDDELLKRGYWVDGGQALQGAPTGKTLRWKNGKVVVTDGPFTETKEQLGGFGVLEARDLDHAVELMSKHPCVRVGSFEIRPVDEEALKRRKVGGADTAKEGAAAPSSKEETIRFACLGYISEKYWEGRSESEFEA